MVISSNDFCYLLNLNIGPHYRGIIFRSDNGGDQDYKIVALRSDGLPFHNIQLQIKDDNVVIHSGKETIVVGNDFEAVKQVLGLYVLAKESIGIRFNSLRCVGQGLIGKGRGFVIKTENHFTAVVTYSTLVALLKAGCVVDGVILKGRGLQLKKYIPLTGQLKPNYAWVINY